MKDFELVEKHWEFNGLEPILVTKKVSEGRIVTVRKSPFYPVRRFFFILKNCYKYAKTLLDGGSPEVCDICGEAIADTYMMDPNPGELNELQVCSRCKEWVHEKQEEEIRRFLEHKK